jgi:hypothetical protein
MKLALRPKPQTVADRAEALGAEALDFVRSLPQRLDTDRKRALAAAGGVASAAAGFAFWRARQDDAPAVHPDSKPTASQAQPPPTKKPVTSSKAAAARAAGTRSK